MRSNSVCARGRDSNGWCGGVPAGESTKYQMTDYRSYILATLTSEVRGHVTSHPVCGRDRDGECGGVPVWVCACVSQTHPLQVQCTVDVCNHCMHFQYTINGYITTLDTPPLPELCSH